MKLRLTRFSIDAIGEDVLFDGFTTGDTWNGWACPYFTFEQAQQLMRAYEENRMRAWYDQDFDAFSFKVGNDDSESDTFSVIEVEGRKLYPIGAFCWIWEESGLNELAT